MGKEAACAAISGTTRGDVKAHLDGERLRLSGAVRLNVPLRELRRVAVRDGALHFEVSGEAFQLQLGPQAAAAWERAIAQPKSLLDKLGVKADARICMLGMDAAFASEVGSLAERAPLTALRGRFDLMFCSLESEADLGRVARCKEHLVPNGALWLVAPKGKTSLVPDRVLRAAISDAGLVDTKVVSFSETHTALKAVIPVAKRTG